MVSRYVTQPREAVELQPGLLCRQLDSVWVLLREQDILMLKFMGRWGLVVLSLPTHKEAHTETPMLFNLSSGATVPNRERQKRVRSSSFAKKTNEEVSDWHHASKYWLFATFTRFFLSPRASYISLPSFAPRRRLLGLRRSFRTLACRSGVDLADLEGKKDHEKMLAKKWRLSTDKDTLVLRPNVHVNLPVQRRAEAT